MQRIIGLILFVLVSLSSLPYLLYWLLWLATGQGLPSKSKEQLESKRNFWRPEEIWALKLVGITAISVGLYRATVFLWTR
jgi:hypothetical protein